MTDTIQSLSQQPEAGDLVQLFIVDLTNIGGTIYRFTPAPLDSHTVKLGGAEFFPVPVEADGFEWNGTGTLPTPTLKISNVENIVSSAIAEYGDLIGGVVTRIRTFKQFLDDGATPDPDALFPLDVYTIERKVAQNKTYVQWELSAAIDQEGVKLPKRQTLRDACTHRYRIFFASTGTFDYNKVTCPYVGSSYFDKFGNATTIDKDSCGKKLSDCKLRFGEGAVLPFTGCPGMARIR
jgi:lambda family phage minor tail protein L